MYTANMNRELRANSIWAAHNLVDSLFCAVQTMILQYIGFGLGSWFDCKKIIERIELIVRTLSTDQYIIL